MSTVYKSFFYVQCAIVAVNNRSNHFAQDSILIHHTLFSRGILRNLVRRETRN